MTVAQWDGRSLAADLAYVKRVTGLSTRRGVLAPLRTVTIAALGGVGTLTHYNYDAGVVVRAHVQGGLEATTVDFPELAAAVKAAGRGVVELERDGDRLVVAGPDGRSSVAVFAKAEDVPVMPTVGGTAVLVADTAVFATAVGAVAPAAGDDVTLPMLTGVHIDADDAGVVSLATTDRFRLAATELTTAAPVTLEAPVLVPAKVLAAAAARVAKREGAVSVYVDGGNVRVSGGDSDVVVRALDCQFPRWRNLLPGAGDDRMRARIAAPDLARRLKKLSVFSVRVTMAADGVRVEAGDLETGQVSTTFDVAAHDVAGRVVGVVAGYNPEYLASLLACAPGEVELTWSPTAPTSRPMTIEFDRVRHLLMPVRLPGAEPGAAAA
ncbi:hypothetical protein CYJ73_21340 [Gordonia terrae]|uniref:DNA polymerase III beta sliding clamp central domain-containing protein n=1 Tax=Gordonia terrae TaxID=2055 RepID=A0A2I1R3A2_9ACTN|nr:DNA polymerase III subunit beta [Gordonia terrae]PKZ63606.1 hypothetical protein CYJ73_21340 [Gordonia terrae]